MEKIIINSEFEYSKKDKKVEDLTIVNKISRGLIWKVKLVVDKEDSKFALKVRR